jgi:putative tricarboxylic transport membrane protein
MSGDRGQLRRDAVTGALALAVSVVYVVQARGIENSLLSDEVGAGGVPAAVGVLLGVVGAVLLFKSLLRGRPSTGIATEDPPTDWHVHRMAAGLLLVLATYVWLLPRLGYVISIVAMVAAVAWLAGSRRWRTIAAMAVVTGPVLWLVFDRVLQVRMPAGVFGG